MMYSTTMIEFTVNTLMNAARCPREALELCYKPRTHVIEECTPYFI